MSDNFPKNGELPGLQVVFGAGPIGSATAHALLRQGLTVRMVTRSGAMPAGLAGHTADGRTAAGPERQEARAADMLNAGAVLAASKGATHIYHCANVAYQDWERVLPPMQDNLVEAAQAHGAVLAVAENLYMYGRGSPVIDESTPEEPPTRKGRLRKRLHDALAEQAARSGLRWAAVRASDYYGPGAGLQSVFGADRFLDPLFAGKRPGMLGNPDLPHTYTYSGDYGRALALAALRPEAHGRAWIVPNDRTLSTRQVAQLFFAAAGRGADVGRIPRAALSLAGLFNPLVRELGEMLYQKEEPYIVDGSLLRSRFGFEPTTLEEGIRATLAWYEARRAVSALGSVARPG